jgi:polyphosphate kinase
LKDNTNSWELESDGHYQRRKQRGKQAAFSAQHYLMQLLGTPEVAS